MAGPLNGIGGQQQIPLATPFQPGQTGAQVRPQDERAPKPNQVQPQGAQAAQSQKSDSTSSRSQEPLIKSTADQDGEKRRGSVVDITV